MIAASIQNQDIRFRRASRQARTEAVVFLRHARTKFDRKIRYLSHA